MLGSYARWWLLVNGCDVPPKDGYMTRVTIFQAGIEVLANLLFKFVQALKFANNKVGVAARTQVDPNHGQNVEMGYFGGLACFIHIG